MMVPILLTAVGAMMVVAAAHDFTTLTIPNWISLVLLGLFPPLAFSAGLGGVDVGMHLAVGIGALLIGVALFAANVVGGGDAKLFAAVSLYMGVQALGPFLVGVTLCGGVLAMCALTLRWISNNGVAVYLGRFQHLANARMGIPYGVAIAAGGLLAFPQTPLFILASTH